MRHETHAFLRLCRPVAKFSIGAFAAMSLLSSVSAQALGPFSEMTGTWRGDGTVVYTDGTRESLHCRSDYSVAADGNALEQSMRCATASYSFRIAAQLSHSGGALSGHWSESGYNLSGPVSGRAAPGSIQATIQGPDFGASIAVSTRDGQQQYSVRPTGTRVAEVVIRLRRQTG